MFGKLMSISDDLMWKYYTLLTDLSPADVQQLRQRVTTGELHPKQAKVDLATRIIADFHSVAEAGNAAAEFERRFSKRELPTDARVVELTAEEWISPLEKRLVKTGLAESMSDARRKVSQGGVRINGVKVAADPASTEVQSVALAGEEYLLQAGKLAAVRVKRQV